MPQVEPVPVPPRTIAGTGATGASGKRGAARLRRGPAQPVAMDQVVGPSGASRTSCRTDIPCAS